MISGSETLRSCPFQQKVKSGPRGVNRSVCSRAAVAGFFREAGFVLEHHLLEAYRDGCREVVVLLYFNRRASAAH